MRPDQRTTRNGGQRPDRPRRARWLRRLAGLIVAGGGAIVGLSLTADPAVAGPQQPGDGDRPGLLHVVTVTVNAVVADGLDRPTTPATPAEGTPPPSSDSPDPPSAGSPTGPGEPGGGLSEPGRGLAEPGGRAADSVRQPVDDVATRPDGRAASRGTGSEAVARSPRTPDGSNDVVDPVAPARRVLSGGDIIGTVPRPALPPVASVPLGNAGYASPLTAWVGGAVHRALDAVATVTCRLGSVANELRSVVGHVLRPPTPPSGPGPVRPGWPDQTPSEASRPATAGAGGPVAPAGQPPPATGVPPTLASAALWPVPAGDNNLRRSGLPTGWAVAGTYGDPGSTPPTGPCAPHAGAGAGGAAGGDPPLALSPVGTVAAPGCAFTGRAPGSPSTDRSSAVPELPG
jgi:translation initiation factor IF-2